MRWIRVERFGEARPTFKGPHPSWNLHSHIKQDIEALPTTDCFFLSSSYTVIVWQFTVET